MVGSAVGPIERLVVMGFASENKTLVLNRFFRIEKKVSILASEVLTASF